jgi:hypothetical protein
MYMTCAQGDEMSCAALRPSWTMVKAARSLAAADHIALATPAQ